MWRNVLALLHFNSHPHEEDDMIGTGYASLYFKFQLTSSRGGWHLISWVVCSSDIFQLTSSRGGWLISNGAMLEHRTFQLTSSRGGWRRTLGNEVAEMGFQLTSSRGGWQEVITWLIQQAYFNSHPHEEDDIVMSNGLVVERISTHILTRRMTLILRYPLLL